MNAKHYYMAIDQHGVTEHSLVHPRKDLCERYGVKHADKMYFTQLNGMSIHIGYVVSGHWFTVYKIQPMERPV